MNALISLEFLFTVLCCIAFTRAFVGQPDANDRSHPKTLSVCHQYIGKLSHADVLRFRDIIQRIQWQSKVVSDLEQLLQHKKTPATDVAEQRAYATSLTADQLLAQLQDGEKNVSQQRELFQATLQKLKQQGLLSDSATEKTMSYCIMGRLNTRLYPNRPHVSFMLQYFKRPWMIAPILAALRTCDAVPSELIVNVDSPDEHQTWAQLAHNTSGYVVPVFSANIHEIRAYNRMAAMSQGRVLIILQDDQEPPSGCQWLNDILAIFNAHPRVAAIGLKGYRFNIRKDNNVTGHDVYFKDPATQVAMQFVQMVDFAPMALRHVAFHDVGGLDEGLSDKGMCGIYSDFEISVRFWAAGWQVAFYRPVEEVKPDSSGKPSGTHTSESEFLCWRRQMGLSGSVYFQRWMNSEPYVLMLELANMIRNLNLKILQLPPNGRCPFSAAFGGCKQAS